MQGYPQPVPASQEPSEPNGWVGGQFRAADSGLSGWLEFENYNLFTGCTTKDVTISVCSSV